MYILPPKRICLSGGGIRTIAYVGALEVLASHGLLKNVREYVGVSAGAFIAFIICVGFTFEEINKIALQYDFGTLRNMETILTSLQLFENFGFDNGQNLVRFMEVILNLKNISPLVTFREFADLFPHRPAFRCFATDLITCHQREFSLAKTPNVTIIHALRVSMSIPIYYTAIPDPETGHLLTDGAVINSCPMVFLSPEEQKESLSISFDNTIPSIVTINNTWDFLQQLFSCVYLPRHPQIMSIEQNEHYLVLPNGDYPPWYFEAPINDRLILIADAKRATEQFLTRKRDRRLCPVRRYSVA